MFKNLLKLVSVILVISICTTSCSKDKPVDNEDDLIVQADTKAILNMGMDSLDTMNPILSKSVSVRECMQLIFEPLFGFDEALNPVSVLAQSCVAADDGCSYTVKIKNGILWHDNRELTASDVEHTINLIRNNESSFSGLLQPISEVVYVDKYTLVLRLSRPVPNFTALLSFPIVQREATTEVVDYIPIGTGPYKYDEKISSDKIQLIPNENWRGTLATIDMVHLNVVKDNQALINAYNASAVSLLSSNVIDLRKNTPRGENNIDDYTSNNLVFLGINNSKSEFSGNNTRRALSYLVNREDIITNEVFSRAVPVSIPVNPSAWYYPKPKTEKIENEQIKELLTLDGWQMNETGKFIRKVETAAGDTTITANEVLTVNIVVNAENEEKMRIAKKIASSFSQFGIETTIKQVSFEDYQLMISEKNYSMFIGEIKLSYNMDLYSLLADNNNYFSFYSTQMKDAVNQLGIAQSGEDVKAAFEQLSVQFLESTPFVPLFFRKESVIFEKSISGVSMPTMFQAFRNPENWYISRKKTTEAKTE